MPHAKHLKIAKYSHLEASHHSVPSAVETSGVLGQAALDLIDDIGRHFHQMMGEPRSKEYLLQRLSIAIQRGNAATVQGTAGRSGERDVFWELLLHVCMCMVEVLDNSSLLFSLLLKDYYSKKCVM